MKIQFIMIKCNKIISNVFIQCVAFIMLLLFCVACNQHETVVVKKEQAKPDSIKAFIATADTAQKTIVLPAELLPNEIVQVRAKVQGYIKTIKVDIGSKVTKGQVLALIDAPEINTRIQELEAKEKSASAQYQSSKDYYNRLLNASKADGVVAPSELEKSKNQMLSDEAAYKAAQFASASYKQVGNYLAIIAPYNGIITKRNINVGSFVGNVNEQPLFEIENSTVLRVSVAVPEVYVNALLIDKTAELTTRSLPDKKFKATLVRTAGTIDNATRSEQWEFEIPNHKHELKAGSYADVKLKFSRSGLSVIVPVSAVVTSLEKKFVIKISNKTTQWVDVRNGFILNDKQEIFGDIKPGDTLVTKANEELKAGKNVLPVIEIRK
jgi:membrane fusion protein, multidrug efflux system